MITSCFFFVLTIAIQVRNERGNPESYVIRCFKHDMVESPASLRNKCDQHHRVLFLFSYSHIGWQAIEIVLLLRKGFHHFSPESDRQTVEF